MHNLRVFSPNKSCAPLRSIKLNQRVLLRFGSTTPLVSKYKYLEINSIDGVKISANKIKMKKSFDKAGIKHSEWIRSFDINTITEFFYIHRILIAKHHHSSKGEGIYYIDSKDALNSFIITHDDLDSYIFEKYYFYPDEYRLHIDVNKGCFYACKKVFVENPEVEWHKHANNSIFVLVREGHVLPNCWSEMIDHCKLAMKEMNLQICCFDVLCSNNDFIIVESNTAPALGNYGITFYSNHLMKWYGGRF